MHTQRTNTHTHTVHATACSAAAKPYIASMGIYVTKASALKELLEVHMPDANDFGNEVRGAAAGGRAACARALCVSVWLVDAGDAHA